MARRTLLVDQRLELDKKGRARVMACGDWHVGSATFDEKLLLENLKKCLDEHIYMICMGDQLEMATRVSPGAGVFSQEKPDNQIDWVIQQLKPLQEAGLLLGIHQGNHEARLSNVAGVNITKLMANAIGCRYLNHAAFHLLRVGKQSYTVHSTHGSSGARLPYSKVKAGLDVFRYVNAELVLYGHLHGLDQMSQLYYEVNKTRKVVETKKRKVVLTGSYLRYRGSYAEKKNMPPVPIGSPIITFYSDEHEMRVVI